MNWKMITRGCLMLMWRVCFSAMLWKPRTESWTGLGSDTQQKVRVEQWRE